MFTAPSHFGLSAFSAPSLPSSATTTPANRNENASIDVVIDAV
jgi:hypothetical protein